MRRRTFILLAMLAGVTRTFSGGRNVDSTGIECATLSVQSNIHGCRVMVDSEQVGETPLNEVEISAGGHVLRFLHPDVNNWLLPAIVETMVARPSEHVERFADFPTVYHVISEPYGAAVQYNDSLIGRTPLIFALAGNSRAGIFTLSREGYDDMQIPVPAEGGIVNASLSSHTGAGVSPLVNGEQVKSLTPVYLSTGAAVASGVVAAYFKIKADGKYDEYRATGNQVTLDQVRKFDSISAVAMVTGEASLLLLSYFLLSR